MHASVVLSLLVAFFCCTGYIMAQKTLNATELSTQKIETSTNVTCITARKDEGTCVWRERCDYGTQSIDFTLYVPHGYTKQCNEDLVCCPADYLLPEPERIYKVPDDFDFDDDD